MRIGLNLFPLLPQTGGIGKFVLRLIASWRATAPEHELVLLAFPHNRPHLDPMVTEEMTVRRLWSPRLLRGAIRDLDVLYCPFGELDPRPAPIASVLLLMDIQEFFFPEFLSRRVRRRRLMRGLDSIKKADRIVAISDFSKNSFVEVLGVDAERVSTIPLCSSVEQGGGRRPSRLPEQVRSFFLYPAIDWPHKNHQRLLQALEMVWSSGAEADLVLTGARHAKGRIHEAARKAGTAAHVHDLGHVDATELAWLYQNAKALVFPSLFEGFGIPLVEAMQAGCPIACSNTSSLPETAGAAALTFDPLDTCSMAAAMQEILTNETVAAQLSEQGCERAAAFNMEKAVREHVKVFESACQAFKDGNTRKSDEHLLRVSAGRRWLGKVPAEATRRARDFLAASAVKTPPR